MSPPLPIALVIHGHFYQPPRENPWTDEVPREPSAAPFHDWNARIHAESYRANAFARIHDGPGRIQAIVNNYERMSFNFGPTLARWIGRHDPDVEHRLRDADAAQRRRLGHGGAVAQAYAHPIVPLCNEADRRTQLRWGLSDFRRRFGRKAEGLWLPETAASPETLEALIDLGVTFTILAPEQIAAVRPAGEEEPWQDVDRESLDTGRAYFWRHRDGSGRRISLAVFDGALSRAVAFGETANRADSLLDAVSSSAERSKVNGQRLVLCASDGELWGHHKKFADLTVAFSTFVEAGRRGIGITNLGAHLSRHPPTWEARLAEGPAGEGAAWSCSHGLGRWTDDCGCNMGGANAGSQAWRRPLRKALDLIRNAAGLHYESAAGELFSDPWGVRDAYGDVVDDTIEARDRALQALGRPALKAGGERARVRARQLLELQRATLLMYASCGWFFDDIAGLEASLVIRMGAHAMDLMREVGGRPPESAVLDVLAQARSNNRQAGTGADVFRRALGSRVTAAHVVGAAALHELVAPGAPVTTPGFDIEVKASVRSGKATGRAHAEQRRTGVAAELPFVASAGPKGLFTVKVGSHQLTLADLGTEARASLVMAALPTLSQEVGNPSVAALIVEAAREFPPNLETAEGLERRAALIRILEGMLHEGTPSAAALRLAAELLSLLNLPPGASERRNLEEAVWILMQRGRPTAALRALADELGFSGFDAVATPQKATAS